MPSTEAIRARTRLGPHPVPRLVVSVVVAVVVFVALLPIWIAWVLVGGMAWLIRTVHRWLEPTAFPWDEIIEFAPVLGWRARPGLRAAARADDVFRFTTDEDGWRKTCSFDTADVVVFGDSFAFGMGVDDRHHFARVAGRAALGRRPIAVKSVGTLGYSLVHELIVMSQTRDALAGKLVVWFVYVGNDILANLSPHVGPYRAPYLRSTAGGEWEIVSDTVTSEPWPWPTWPSDDRDLAELCCGGTRSRRAYDACDFLIGQGHDICTDVGARLVVALIPNVADFDRAALRALAPDAESFDPDRPKRELAAICARRGVPFVDFKAGLGREHYKVADLHWNESGNRRVAAMLRAIVIDAGVRSR